jgi:tetratricopeptide (TPR) repeat protein
MMLLANRDEPNWFWKPSYSQFPAFVLSGMALCALSFHLWAVVEPSRQLRAAEDAHLEDAGSSLALYRIALDHPMHAPITREEYALALMQAGHADAATQQFMQALGSVDSGRVYLALGMLAEGRGDLEEAQRCFRECLWRWPNNLEARFYLAPE